MKIRKPSVWYYGYKGGWYGKQDAKEVIEGYLSDNETLMSRVNSTGSITRRIRLSEIFRGYSEEMPPSILKNSYQKFHYWSTRTPENLTEEDKSFLRWVLRRGRLNDAPTRDPGVKINLDTSIDTRKE